MLAMEVPAPTAPLTGLDAVASGIDDMADEDLHRLTSDALCDHLLQAHTELTRLQAQLVRVVGVFERTQAYAPSGALSAAAWLRHNCRLSPAAASQLVKVARQLCELPATARAFAAGEIGLQHASLISRTAEDVGTEVAREAEPVLLGAAREVDAGRFRLVTQRLRHCFDQDGALEAFQRDHERRRLHLSQTLDGLFVLDGILDPEGGSALRTALDALLGPPAPDDQRSAAQRRADALVELARGELDRGQLPEQGGQRPHLVLTASLETLRREPEGPVAELDWGLAGVPSETVHRFACDCRLSCAIVDSDGEPLSIGHASRVIPPALRTALAIRDRGCRWPGCGRPVRWCDGHHVVSWLDGGKTSLSNLWLICRSHHRLLHEGGWQLRPSGDGSTLTVIPPRSRSRGP